MSTPIVDALVLGAPPSDMALIAVCRDESNRSKVDPVVLPDGVQIEASLNDEGLPHHPMVVIRCFENIQMMLCPRQLRNMAAWLYDAADWLEDSIEEGL